MKKIILPRLLTLLAFLLMTMPSLAHAQSAAADTQSKSKAAPHVQVKLIAERSPIQANDTIWIGVQETIADGWHTYWRNPGDSGTTPRIKWHLPKGFEMSDVNWPAPQKIRTGPLTNYGYEGKITLLQSLTVPPALPEGPIKITADIELLVCKNICVPEFGCYSLTLNNDNAFDHAAEIDKASQALPFNMPLEKESFSEQTKANGNYFVLHVRFESAQFLKFVDQSKPIAFIPQDWGILNNSAAPDVNVTDDAITITQLRGDRPLTALNHVKGVITYYDLTGQYSAIEINAEKEGMSAAQIAANKAHKSGVSATIKAEATANQKAPLQNTANTTFLSALFFAFLGGLILNLMPCVFPILSMKAISLCNLHGKELRMARKHGIFYTFGVIASFAAIAAALITLQKGGAEIGWGFQLQNPSVVLFLSWLLFLIGLNLSGYFNLRVLMSDGGNRANEHSVSGSFFTGILATLVATPCTAPFMGAALGYALLQPPAVSMSIFLALGFGLAFPYLLLSFFPALRAFLPKPGAWMETFKEFLAFPMFASAIWLVWVYSGQDGSLGLIKALGGMVLMVMGLWAVRKTQKDPTNLSALKGIIFNLIAFAALVGTLFIFITDMKARQINARAAHLLENTVEEEPYSAALFEEIMKGDQPLFVNMTADWCITCKVNEHVGLSAPATKLLFKDLKLRYLKGDWTNQNSEITKYLAKYGRNGVPLYVYYGAPDKNTGQRPAPIVLPQILTPSIIRDAIAPNANIGKAAAKPSAHKDDSKAHQ